MKRILFFLTLSFTIFLLNADALKIKTVESYNENSNGRKTFNNDHTIVFEVDTIGRTLIVKSVLGERSYKMNSRPSIISSDRGRTIKFDVPDASLTRKYSIFIPDPLAGNKISVREIIATKTRELPASIYYTDKFTSDGTPLTYTTKYVSTHFHDINETGPMLDNKCAIGLSDTAILIGDLDGTNYGKMLLVTSVEDVSNPSIGKKQKIYYCMLTDEEYIFTVNYPDNEYSTPIFELTRIVYGKPVTTIIYSGDFIK